MIKFYVLAYLFHLSFTVGKAAISSYPEPLEIYNWPLFVISFIMWIIPLRIGGKLMNKAKENE